MRLRGQGRIPSLILLGFLTLPTVTAGQTTSLSWTQISRVDASSMLAPVLRMAGVGDPVESRHAIHLQGGAMIQVTDDGVGVVDLDAGHVLMIDHAQGTVIRMTFEEVAAFTGQLVTMFSQTMNAMGPEMMQAQQEMAASMGDMQYALNAWASGLTGDFGGFEAAQHYVTLGMEMAQAPQGTGASGAGQMYVVSEIWETDQVPTEAELFGEWGARVAVDPGLIEVAQSMGGESGESLSTSFAMWDPGLAQAMVAMTEAIDGIGGTTVREAMVIAMASPDGAPPVSDIMEQGVMDELLAWDPGSSGGGGSMPGLGDIARNALGGVFGGGGDPEPEPEAATPGGMTPLVRIVTDKENLEYGESNDDVLGELTEQIEGYSVQSFQDIMDQMNQFQPPQ